MFMTVICLAPDQVTARRLVAAAHALEFPLRYVEMLPEPEPSAADAAPPAEAGGRRADPEFAALLVALGLAQPVASASAWSATRPEERAGVASLAGLLHAWGLPDPDAERYASRVADGAVFVAIHAAPARMREAHDVLASHGGEEIADTDLGHAERIRVREVAAAPAARTAGR